MIIIRIELHSAAQFFVLKKLTMMSANDKALVACREYTISQKKGNRKVHYYLKVSYRDFVLVASGTLRGIKHMIYVASDEFLKTYGFQWLTCLVPRYHQPLGASKPYSLSPHHSICGARLKGEPFRFTENKIAESLGSPESEMPGSTNLESQAPDQMLQVPIENHDIIWSGDSSICSKKLKHYKAFIRDGTTIAVYSFALILAGEGSHHVGYLEDLFEDYRRQKMVKVRWFHRRDEVSGIIPDALPHEVIMTPDVQVISAECIDGLATILTPKHYDQCLVVVSQDFLSDVYVCSRQINKNKVKPFPLYKLRGYSNQATFSSLYLSVDHNKLYQQISSEKGAKEMQSCHNQVEKAQPTHPQLKSKGLVPCFNIGEEIEVLSEDSGMRGRWFRCKILDVLKKHLKVVYTDIEDAEGSGNLEERIPAYRIAAADKAGMRWSGRHTIRPYPPRSCSISSSHRIGGAVDAWWCDGWWEGVVVGLNIPTKNHYRVYCPGEDMFLNIEKKKLRTSRDWVDNRWVDIKPKPDVLSKMKLLRCSTLAGTGTSPLPPVPKFSVEKGGA